MLVLSSGTLLVTGQNVAHYHGNCSVINNVPAIRCLAEFFRMQVTVRNCPDVSRLRKHCQGTHHFTIQLHLRYWVGGVMIGWYCSYCSSATYEVSPMCGAASKISSTLQSQKTYKGSYATANNYAMMVLQGTEERLHTMLTSELSTQEMLLGQSQTQPRPPHS